MTKSVKVIAIVLLLGVVVLGYLGLSGKLGKAQLVGSGNTATLGMCQYMIYAQNTQGAITTVGLCTNSTETDCEKLGFAQTWMAGKGCPQK